MKAWLYAIAGPREWHWRISLDMNADLDYWFERSGEQAEIRWLEPSVSFGQAVELKAALGRQGGVDRDEEHKLLTAVQHAAKRISLPENLIRHMTMRRSAYPPGEAMTGRAAAEMKAFRQCMQGRSLYYEEIVQLIGFYGGLREIPARPKYFIQRGYLEGWLDLEQGIFAKPKTWWARLTGRSERVCRRCGGSEHLFYTECLFCETLCPYCEQCLNMGKIRYCSPLVSVKRESAVREPVPVQDLTVYTDSWGLSDIQADASGEALRFLAETTGTSVTSEPRRFLIWAVTGAGKTEMIFPLIAFELSHGGRVLVTTPRKDVVLELEPRLSRAFHDIKVVTLYGGSKERWERGELTIATTHQLLRFAEAFDLIIIDEIDAFPYHNNPMLEHAARRALVPGGSYIYLSATPPEPLQKAVRRRDVACARVPARYHRHPLPVPKILTVKPLRMLLKNRSIPSSLLNAMKSSINRGAQLFIFVPKIQLVDPLVSLLRTYFPGLPIEGTSSKDEGRGAKVVQFRATDVRMLVTTTILERGVTIPKSDVIILDADAPIFDSAALVQMAGRAGRSKDDPAGNVYFARQEKTAAQVKAIKQITDMNKIAWKKGYLLLRGGKEG
ncbi:DEAD/DEAH box helicase [Paenibacillus hamazuiensis]|uniref:DEAD/DEAH box helicase n=1 Tax=Paenibacillus hamazuiensis TaxID=2936508 RepID=UPI00200ECBE1|nr:helicase-related protein [Paenibacillus hamazuiensis]